MLPIVILVGTNELLCRVGLSVRMSTKRPSIFPRLTPSKSSVIARSITTARKRPPPQPTLPHLGQMLAIASNQKRDSLKVIHSASCTPFTNWPTERTPVRYPFALDFSPGGGFLAVGNDRGCVLLYRIRHYPQA